MNRIIAHPLRRTWHISARRPERRGHRFSRLLALLPLACCLCVQAAGEKDLDPALGFTDCSIGNGVAKLVAQCTTLSVPLNPDSDDAGTLDLSIARIPARRQSARQDAFTLLAGGPGQSAIESFPSVAFAFRHIMRDRDILLVDQRGTGNSVRLSCPESPDYLGAEFDEDTQFLTDSAKACLEQLDSDPRYFTTSVAVQDLEQVRQSLGISQWNLYGISYGTRVALHYLRRYPDKVRTLILDAVVPPTVPLGPDIAPLAQRSLDIILQRCANAPGCSAAFGDIGQATRELLDALREQPRTITYEDVASGQMKTMEFTWQHLAVTLRLLSYSSQTAAILPSMLNEAIANDNFAPLARQTMLQAQSLGDSMATGMHHAVICTEDAPYLPKGSIRDESAEDPIHPQTASREKDDGYPADSYMGDDVVSSLLATCAAWPAGLIDDDFRQAVTSAVPTLILSGEADPITPPAYGETVASSLSRARHIINPQQGHMQAPFGCMPALLAQFVETEDAERLDTACLDRINPLPFFVDANGPLP